MTDAIPAERMPAAVQAARAGATLQLGFALLLFAMTGADAVAGAVTPMFLVWLLQLLLVVVIMGLLVFRWSSRRKWVRWCAVAVEAVTVGGNVVAAAISGELGWGTLVNLGAVLPVAILVILLTPSAARWFDR
ncbi:hypothetical protein [Nonomuraea rhodomycinica]|uniref:Uncharacterized protein n=1 Tax=Nonomuraea rhodomycinica TaxID=1712872 RepID=A0A7Y6IUZ1_9ACTN|nr:hypothetical protein [Nonomuraea rhodomycinica]NUW44877.1 hypothetical protein [Nonomuraea rhodomycinica]